MREESRKLLEENNDFLTTLLFLVLMTVTSDDCDERISKYARKPEKWFKIKSKISDAQLKVRFEIIKSTYLLLRNSSMLSRRSSFNKLLKRSE